MSNFTCREFRNISKMPTCYALKSRCVSQAQNGKHVELTLLGAPRRLPAFPHLDRDAACALNNSTTTFFYKLSTVHNSIVYCLAVTGVVRLMRVSLSDALSVVRDLGVFPDAELSPGTEGKNKQGRSAHVSLSTQTCFFHLHASTTSFRAETTSCL